MSVREIKRSLLRDSAMTLFRLCLVLKRDLSRNPLDDTDHKGIPHAKRPFGVAHVLSPAWPKTVELFEFLRDKAAIHPFARLDDVFEAGGRRAAFRSQNSARGTVQRIREWKRAFCIHVRRPRALVSPRFVLSPFEVLPRLNLFGR